MTCFKVGHNDPGYEPDEAQIEVPSWGQAISCVKSLIQSYFLIEIEEGPEAELTAYDVQTFKNEVFSMKPNSTRILRGHAFWIHTS